jgi:hypothetical protein
LWATKRPPTSLPPIYPITLGSFNTSTHI